MDNIVYCYMDTNKKVNPYRSNTEELEYSKSQKNVCYYNKYLDGFFDQNGLPFSITDKIILMRTSIKYIDTILEAIERKGGIPINSRQDINRIINWKKEISVNHSYLFAKGKEIIENEEVRRKIVELSNEKGFFLKTVEKDFSGVIPIEELFDSSRGLLPALELHRETDFIISEAVDILSDEYGKLEFRCFVVDGKILNISRNLLCTYHNIETGVWEQANNLLNRIKRAPDFPITFCMDIMVASSFKNKNLYTYDILELNPLEASGEYLYNTVWQNSIDYTENLETESQLVTSKDSIKVKMQDLVPIYKKRKKLGFTKELEPNIVMKQCYFLDEFSYHYGCARKFGNPKMGRFFTHTLFSSGNGKKIDIIDVLNDNIGLNDLLLLSGEELLRKCGADLEYMHQQIKLEEYQSQSLEKKLL